MLIIADTGVLINTLTGLEEAMREIIIDFCEAYHYPAEARQALLSVWDNILTASAVNKIFSRTREDYEKNPLLDFQELLRQLKAACEEERIPWEPASLLFFICLTPQLYGHYERRDLPKELCRASLEDLKWKLLECRKVYGIWGTFVSDWFDGFFRLTRFTLGRLQFELIPFPQSYEKAGRVKPAEISQAINIHIPSSGPLLHEECLRSYQLAMDFFRPSFPEGNYAFFCNSWLLFPEHPGFLPAGSRILEFMADFDIYASWQDPQGSDLWRIFGLPDCSDTAHLPENTALQRAYKKWLLSGAAPGTGSGLFLSGT